MSIVLQDIFGRQYSLEIPLRIGSDSSNDIVLLDSSISPFHAEVRLQGDAALVVDQDSDFGVFVNQQQIFGSAQIKAGDWFSVGKVLFTLTDSQSIKPVLPPGAREDTAQRDLVDETLEKPDIPPPVPETDKVVIPGIIPPIDATTESTADPKSVNIEPPRILDVEKPAADPEPEAVRLSESVPARERGPKPESEPEAELPAEHLQPSELESSTPVEFSGEKMPEPVPSVEKKPSRRKPIGLVLILGIVGLLVLAAAVVGFFVFQGDTDLPTVIASLTGGTTSSTPGEGPTELDLSDAALHTNLSTSFIQQQTDVYEGLDETGAALKIDISQTTMEQSTPIWSNYSKYLLVRNDVPEKDSEFSILNGQVYLREKGKCSVFTDKDTGMHIPTNWTGSYMKSFVTGTARKVETGVKVNGILTDKYELKVENSPFAGSLLQMPAGELYRAQNGGYLVKMKIVQQWAAGKWKGAGMHGFAANQPVTVSTSIDFTYYPEGKLNVIVPAVCAGKIQPAP